MGVKGMFPESEDEFRDLEVNKKTIEYVETENKQTVPDGSGWVYWSDRITPNEHVAVWRRTIAKEE